MKLSMMSYTWARRPRFFDLKNEGQTLFFLDGMLALTRELDLAGIDFVTLHGMEAGELRRRADDHGVPVVCHTFYADLNHPDPEGRRKGAEACRRGIEAAVVLGAPVVMVVTPGKKGLSRGASRRNWIAGLNALVPLAGDAGITLTVENFAGVDSPFVVAADLLEAVHAVPGLKITCDPGNAATGEQPADSFRRVAEHVVHVHLKDWTLRQRRPWRLGYRRMLDGRWYRPALIGEGDLDQRALLAVLKDCGYDGCINIEYEGHRYRPGEAVRRAAGYLRGFAAELNY